jgi:Putative adhesin
LIVNRQEYVMPTFQTPEPILAYVEVVAGSVRLRAGDRDDTVVEVRPRDPSRAADVRVAEQARIDFDHGKLTVSAGRKILSLGRGGAVDIDIALPTRSRLQASSASATVHAEGVLGDCRFSSASGDMRVATVEGNIKADTASGDVAAHSVRGNAVISTASGDATIGQLEGDLKFQAASGGITIGRLHGNAKAQTASGSVAVATAVNGAFTAQTSSGEVEVGIPEGTAARLDLATSSGVVSNGLEPSEGPAEGDERLVVHARTGSGDILVRRATGPAAA